MRTGSVLLITDQPACETRLIDAVQRISDCQPLVTTQPWFLSVKVIGVIVDVDLKRIQTRSCLDWLRTQLQAEKPPILFLTDNTASAALREARAHGATACLPRYTEARTVAASLFRLIYPGELITDFVIRRGTSRASSLITDMFKTASTGTVDLSAVESSLGPVISAIEEGGITRWLDIVWEHNDSTFQHCLLVAGLTASFSRSLGLSISDQMLMTRGALLHDVGKAQVPREILDKPGKLDQSEMAIMRTHANIGYEILKSCGNSDSAVLAMTRHHHEMLDGSGYPDGLNGKMIADPIRLLTICDIYAALIERRSYKEPYSHSEAMNILQSMEGKLEGALIQSFGKSLVFSHNNPGQTAA